MGTLVAYQEMLAGWLGLYTLESVFVHIWNVTGESGLI